MELTKSSRFEYGNTAITLQRLVIVNPVLFKTYFTANSSFILSEEALECVNKIRNRLVRIKILAIDTYRKKLVKERKENELYNSSDNLMMGNYGNYAFRMFITRY